MTVIKTHALTTRKYQASQSAKVNELKLKLNYWVLISCFVHAMGHFDINCLFHFFLRRAHGAFESYHDERIALLP